jgi:transposase-like protein
MGRHGYPPESRRKVLELVEAGRPIAEVARALGISDQSIYTWRRQDRIDRGLEPGLTSPEKTELLATQCRIAELETELRAMRRAIELVREVVPPKGGSSRVAQSRAPPPWHENPTTPLHQTRAQHGLQ